MATNSRKLGYFLLFSRDQKNAGCLNLPRWEAAASILQWDFGVGNLVALFNIHAGGAQHSESSALRGLKATVTLG